MDKVNVNDLAQEFNVKSSLVMNELKKIGVMVISADTSVDHGIADRVRKRLQLLADQAVEEAQKAERLKEKAAKAKAKKKEAAEAAKPKARKSIKELGKKAAEEAAPAPEEVEPAQERTAEAAPAVAEVPAEEKPAPKKRPAKAPSTRAIQQLLTNPEAAPDTMRFLSKSIGEEGAKAIVDAAKFERKQAKKSGKIAEKRAPAPEIPAAMKPRKGKKHFTRDDELVDLAEAPPSALAQEALAKPSPAPVPRSKVAEPSAAEEPVAARPAASAASPATAKAAAPAAHKPISAAPPKTPTAGLPVVSRAAPEARRLAAKPATILKKSTAEPVSADIGKKIERIIPAPPPAPAPRPFPGRPPQHRREKRDIPAVPRVPPPILRPERPVFTELKPVTLSEAVSVKELSEKLNVKSKDILRELLNKGVLATINQTLDDKIASEVCELFGYKANIVSFEEELFEQQAQSYSPEDRIARAPVVTVMGHVDHGKTSLLDAIREAKVAQKEAGGITQHIGAYHVDINNRRIVFLDTPGHEAFTLMRARGAKVTDIVVLVVAADDGVMPQTIEAINHARAANVPIIVAINKIDKSTANVDRVKQELAEHNLLAEDWGGQTVTVPVSALQKTNLDLLLEMILLVADILDLKANPKLPATGAVLEAKLDKGRGSVATVLVQNGTAHVGDSFIVGAVYGKVRAMFDDRVRPVDLAGPSSAVEILGLQGIPAAGDPFQVIDDTVKAKQIGSVRQTRLRERDLQKSSRLTLDHLFEQLKTGDVKELPIVIKADVQGSAEVLKDSLQKLSTEKVKLRVVHAGVGAITETDVLFASASNAIIVGFNVRPEKGATELAEQETVDIRLHTVIYNVANEIKSAMLGLLETTYKEKHQGRAEVRETFRVPKVGTVAGAYAQDGTINRGAEARLLRDNVIVYEGKIRSLKRFKDDVSEVKSGYEFGFSLENFNDIKIGDVLEAFTQEKVQPKLM